MFSIFIKLSLLSIVLLPGEPSMARLLNALTIDSFIRTDATICGGFNPRFSG